MTATRVIDKIIKNGVETKLPDSFSPENSWIDWNVLRRTSTWYGWWPCPSWFAPDSSGSDWQLLKKTSTWYDWATFDISDYTRNHTWTDFVRSVSLSVWGSSIYDPTYDEAEIYTPYDWYLSYSMAVGGASAIRCYIYLDWDIFVELRGGGWTVENTMFIPSWVTMKFVTQWAISTSWTAQINATFKWLK